MSSLFHPRSAVLSNPGTKVSLLTSRHKTYVVVAGMFIVWMYDTEDMEVLWAAIYEVAKSNVAQFTALPHVSPSEPQSTTLNPGSTH
jgi:hypothetical protein